MPHNLGTWVKALALVGVGMVAGAAGGVGVWQKAHPPLKLRPDMTGAPGGISLAPPEGPPEEETGTGTETSTEEPTEVKPPDPVDPKPPDPEPPAEPPTPKVAGPEFFGFPVGSTEAAAPPPAPEPKPEPKPEPRPEPKPKPKPPPAPAVAKLRFMNGRCVAGFDGTTTLHDFSGWTKSVTGEIEYQKGKLAETVKASVTVDARTLDTGDKDRDKEMHETNLESQKYHEMKFVLSGLRMGEGQAATMKGTIEIHGTSREVEMPITLTLRRDGFIYVKGELKARISDFKVEVPSKLGMINVDDNIRIWFEVWAEPLKGEKK
ncbi:MAG: YceI family protein [Planctomycetes bacterium]|nr:YceI family protein [Planctomycetota bacterium]